ncbi:hypothetical protein GCM10028824_31890 [Hymenobacter segetis]|uniref:Uncharacterized protein n=1 Tax=Hymenobacter segetis TaxID=2025509 RepID=A0ABU9LPJ7_9BACT
MIRSVLTLILALAIAAEASAQTAPATKTAARKTTTTRKTTAKKMVTRNTTARPAPAETGGRTKTGPAGNGSVGSTESADGKGQSVYAAPGMPVNVDNPKKVEGYNGPAPARTKSRTTLTPR